MSKKYPQRGFLDTYRGICIKGGISLSMAWRKFARPGNTRQMAVLNVGKAFDGLGEPGNSVLSIAMFDAVAHAVADMAFQNDLANPVQGRLGSVNLGKNVLAGNILVYHAVYGLDLSYDFVETAVQVCLIHALLHLKLCGQAAVSFRMNRASSLKGRLFRGQVLAGSISPRTIK